jgi:hypothetical protein
MAFDLAIDSYGAAIAHEYGHSARAEESGRSADIFLAPFNGSHFRMRGAPLTPLETMSVFGGGLEGGHVLSDRISDLGDDQPVGQSSMDCFRRRHERRRLRPRISHEVGALLRHRAGLRFRRDYPVAGPGSVSGGFLSNTSRSA